MSSGFDEYAALARHLHDLHRTGQAGSAQHITRLQRLSAHADQLGHRLYAQWQRLAAIGQATGEQVPAAPPPLVATPAADSAPGQQRSAGYGQPPGGYGQPPGGGYGAAPAGVPWPPPPPGRAVPGPAGLPPPPRRPELATGEQRIPLPASASGAVLPYDDGSGAGVAGPVSGGPVSGGPVSGGPVSAVPVSGDPAASGGFPPDPEQELEAARRQLDEADAAANEAEQAAARPPLLPNWSPLSRAVTVYLAFSAGVAFLQFLMLMHPMVRGLDTGTQFAWICAGFPTIAFFSAYLVLSKWGRSPLETDGPPRFPKIGFLLCFAAAPFSMILFLLLNLVSPF